MPMMKAGNKLIPVEIIPKTKRLWLKFGFNKAMIEEVKMMEGAKYHGFDPVPVKQWSIPDTPRNRFQLAYLEHCSAKDPLNPYAHYDKPLLEDKPSRSECREHQIEMFQHGITRRHCILAAEMGTGKTLAAIEILEWLGFTNVWWVAPKSALYSAYLEFDKWKAKIRPRMMSYEGFRTLMGQYTGDAPHVVIFDEASRLKNPTAQRTQAARHLADAIRKEHGYNSGIVLMSGSPAPKSPADWWSLCEIVCPGFLREGSIDKLKKTIAVIKTEDNGIGGSYPKLVAYRDSEERCQTCGQFKESFDHDPQGMDYHPFVAGVNEVHRLYRRMTGLVQVKFKKDCLKDLPDKIYRIIRCKPSQTTLNLARLVQARASSTLQALILLRELSDGFQYTQTESGVEVCGSCNGSRTEAYYVKDDAELTHDDIQSILAQNQTLEAFKQERACGFCSGSGLMPSFIRTSREVKSEKEEVLRNLLEEHEEVGRIVIYGGFTGTLDKLVNLVRLEGWELIRADGRGWFSPTIQAKPEEMIVCFQNPTVYHPKIAFIGHPGAAGMGLTLTASPSIVYYSNDFNAESRIQSEDRIHRIGMDVNKGATIYDIFNLPTDELIYNNLKKKRKLQTMSMGDLQAALNMEIPEGTYTFDLGNV